MCTCINLKTKDFYFGRTLDLEYRFEEKVVITPRSYPFQLQNGGFFKTKYAIIGIAYVKIIIQCMLMLLMSLVSQ